jgi:hypothetical protein
MFRILSIFLILISLSAKAQQPQLKGNLEAFIKNNIIYPPFSLNNCIQGTIKIGFKLNAKGEVYESAVTQGLGIDLDDEALRLIRMSSGQWIVNSSHDTTALLVVPVSFELKDYGCENKSKADIALAIQSYKNQEALFNVILNFYKSKEKGNYKKEDENKILLIKNELGVDNEFLDKKLSSGLKKYKQGDKIGACEEFNFVKYMGSDKADEFILKYCK